MVSGLLRQWVDTVVIVVIVVLNAVIGFTQARRADQAIAALRQLAAESSLSNADAPDSQEICFIPSKDYVAYIESRGVVNKPGRFLAPDGRVLGPHKGILHYTVGQRKGLGVALGHPVFVRRILPNGDVALTHDEALYAAGVALCDVVHTAPCPLPENESYTVKIRSMAAPVPCRPACITLVTSVGRIRAASAVCGGSTDAKADIMIIGMAKPTAPLTKPANSVTAKTNQKVLGSRPNMAAD